MQTAPQQNQDDVQTEYEHKLVLCEDGDTGKTTFVKGIRRGNLKKIHSNFRSRSESNGILNIKRKNSFSSLGYF